MKKLQFNNAKEYQNFIKEQIEKLNKDQEYNFYLHQVSNIATCYLDSNFISKEDLKRERIEGILSKGLRLDRYSTLCGTARFFGSSKSVDVSKLIGYSYDDKSDQSVVCFFALPKFINARGGQIEFSSFEGKSAAERPEKLVKEYKFAPDLRHFKCSLFDCIKGEHMPSQYFLGMQITDLNKQTFEFIDPETHLINLNESEKKPFADETARNVENLFEKHGTTDLAKVIVKTYKADEAWINSQYDFDL